MHFNYLYYRATLLPCLWFALYLPSSTSTSWDHLHSILPAALWSCTHRTKETAGLKAVVSSSGITFWKRKGFSDKNYKTPHLSVRDFFEHHSSLTTVDKRCWKHLYKAFPSKYKHKYTALPALRLEKLDSYITDATGIESRKSQVDITCFSDQFSFMTVKLCKCLQAFESHASKSTVGSHKRLFLKFHTSHI